MASSLAVVGEEAEEGVLLRVLHAFRVRRHVRDIDGVLLRPFLFGGTWRGGGGAVPVQPLPRDVGQVALEGRPVLGRVLAGFMGGLVVSGLVAPQAVGQMCPRCPITGWGLQGGHFAGSLRGGGPRGRLLWGLVLAGFGPYAASRPPCV